MMRKPSVIALSLLLVVSAPGLAQPAATAAYRIVVNPRNPETTVDRTFLENAFLKKVTRWPDDEVIRPAELTGGTLARRSFSEQVLERSVEAVKGYWQQRIFSGRDVPPPEFSSDQEVINYVLKYEGAIGCVSANANLDGVKTLIVQ
jgi:hypothetical protein